MLLSATSLVQELFSINFLRENNYFKIKIMIQYILFAT